MEILNIDFAVIGSGPAGQKGAIQAAKLGKSVVIIEKDVVLGGNCLNSGTIPSKSLRAAIIDLRRYNERAFYGSSCMTEVSINDLNYRLNAVLEGERAILHRQLRKNHILHIRGMARFKNPHTLEIVDEKGEVTHQIIAKKYLIATGSEPRNPLHVPFDEQVILDSTRLLSIDRVPKTMLVLGGGVIGAEYASFFTALGCKVTVLDKRERLLPQLDAEIGTHLQVGLNENGLTFAPKKVPKEIKKIKGRAHVTCEDGSLFEGDALLYALGREAQVQTLELELEMTKYGYITINPFFQTSHPHIYAAGDVVGFPALASTSLEQGRLAARHAFGEATHEFPSFFPLGIYTIPEISCCGLTEEELIKKGVDYEVGRAYYYEIARSHITGSSNLGLFKILFCKKTLKLFGVHIVGRSATELIHIGQLAMSFHATLDYFVDQVFNYPTFAEGYRIAAFNGLNKIK
ncbi:MAG: putative soluble pyridine nucleotide transhydrogenase [Chlamydiales bacterium]|nr:putative soluble pyridine nucleotide transhydrogenase [Chlamydiales bacterium]MCH9620216.1 putative soluble pyridine nucleotide transhydrogenase [Chlamydiales bacterium]MCH9623069.1 putative soluble pyridine nucleotide transhydrogenase [Chlamydiales bacterium]